MEKEIYVNEQLSSRKIMEILEEHPNIKKIKCPSSLYLRTSPKYLDALSKLGIEIEPVLKRGRPKKYGEEEVEIIDKMLKGGSTPQEISNILNIPLKSVYHLKKNPLKRGRKRKYTPETEKEIKILYKEGFSARDISEKLKIPLRTVYALIKR